MSDNDNDYQRILRNLEAAGRPPEEPAPAEQAKAASLRVRVPLFTPWVARILLAINILVFVGPWLLDVIGIRIAGVVSVYQLTLIWGAKEMPQLLLAGSTTVF